MASFTSPPLSKIPEGPMFLADGTLSKEWFWYLYQILTTTVRAFDLQVLEAFDSATRDGAAIAAAEDTGRLAALAGDAPAVRPADLDELRKLIATQQDGGASTARLDDLEKLIWLLTGDSGRPALAIICDTHANRALYPAAAYPSGAIYKETDRKAVYITGPPVNAGVWVYAAGAMPSTSATLADLPGDLGANDAGFEFRSSYFFRKWTWNGAAWHYSDGGAGAGSQVSTSSSATPPSGGLWQACDGSTVACALDNATLGNLTASDTRVVAGDNPMIQGGVGGAPANPAKPTLSADATVTVGTDTDAGTDVAPAGATLVALHGHLHLAALKQADFTTAITTPTEANGGLPLRVSMAWWMRR